MDAVAVLLDEILPGTVAVQRLDELESDAVDDKGNEPAAHDLAWILLPPRDVASVVGLGHRHAEHVAERLGRLLDVGDRKRDVRQRAVARTGWLGLTVNELRGDHGAE